jgi:hypothetical protein
LDEKQLRTWNYPIIAYFFIASSNMSPINVPIMNMTTRIITVMNIPIAVAAEYTRPPIKSPIKPKIIPRIIP